MKELIDYIISFLLGVDSVASTGLKIGYTADFREFDNFDVVIKSSGFFDFNNYGKPESLPVLPLKIWDETPILYGEPYLETIGNTLVLHADIVAGTYFLIARYEEMIRKNIRDIHGRFPGKESLPYRAGFIDRPIIEEWGQQLRVLLRSQGHEIADPPRKINKIYLTHDVDNLEHFRNVRGVIGGLIHGIKRPKEGQRALRSFFGRLVDDPWYTFPFLFRINNELRKTVGYHRAETIVFVRSMGARYKEDKPFPNLNLPDYKYFLRYCRRKSVTIGLHCSYECGVKPSLIMNEKNRLEKAVHNTVLYNRNHFMNCREPRDMLELIKAGITDDFSLGYADMAGFRLGTCKPVRYINPETRQLTDLRLHSLNIMDRTLSDKRYMYMNSFDAMQYCTQLINNVEQYNGEITLLWHNNLVEKTPNSYHRNLYAGLLKILQEKA